MKLLQHLAYFPHGLRARLARIPNTGVSPIGLRLTALHRCWRVLQVKSKTLHRQKSTTGSMATLVSLPWSGPGRCVWPPALRPIHTLKLADRVPVFSYGSGDAASPPAVRAANRKNNLQTGSWQPGFKFCERPGPRLHNPLPTPARLRGPRAHDPGPGCTTPCPPPRARSAAARAEPASGYPRPPAGGTRRSARPTSGLSEQTKSPSPWRPAPQPCGHLEISGGKKVFKNQTQQQKERLLQSFPAWSRI